MQMFTIFLLMYLLYCASNFRLRSISSRSSTDDRLNTPSVLNNNNNNNNNNNHFIYPRYYFTKSKKFKYLQKCDLPIGRA